MHKLNYVMNIPSNIFAPKLHNLNYVFIVVILSLFQFHFLELRDESYHLDTFL